MNGLPKKKKEATSIGESEDIRYKDPISRHITKTADYQNRCKGHKELIMQSHRRGGGGGGGEAEG